ncbi:MAG: hypothetical protein ACOX8V_07195, partial [Thermoleophilia bacterium]
MANSTANKQDLPLFGRTGDLNYLLERREDKGITAIVGRAQVGKSSLLRELKDNEEVADGWIVGYAESTSEGSDLLLRAIADAYACWLKQASALDKLKSVHQQVKKTPGSFITGVIEGLLKITEDVLPLPGVGAVQNMIGGLLSASDMLKTGGLHLSPLDYDKAKELVELLSKLAPDQPLVLILDRFDGCRPVEQAVAPLQVFCDHYNSRGWPQIHFFLGVRQGPEEAQRAAVNCVYELKRRRPAIATVKELGPMDLSDPGEQSGLIKYLNEVVPVTNRLEPEEILKPIDGHPGVISRWRDAPPATIEELRNLAKAAHAYSYEELGRDFQTKAGKRPARQVLARLALLPQLHTDGLWKALEPLVMGGIDDDVADDLVAERILYREDGSLTYGHLTRHEAARHYWTTDALQANFDLRTYAYQEIDWIVREAGSRVRRADWDILPFCLALVNLLSLDSYLLDDEARAVCLSAASLLPLDETRKLVLTPGMSASAAAKFPEAVGLLAMGLFNARNDAKEEDDLTRRDELFHELRTLANAHPYDAMVRVGLTGGLFNTLNDAKKEGNLTRRDELLDELRILANAHPDDAIVRRGLAEGLVTTLNDAKEEGAPTHRDEGLDELRILAHAHPDDAMVREGLAKGLLGTLLYAKEEGHLTRRDELLDELRILANAHPDDAMVGKGLAGGLANALNDAKEEDDLTRRDELLDELQTLAKTHPDDAM